MSCFEDVRVGERTVYGQHTFTAEEIRRFASAFDPQPFHLDEAAARASHFGGIIASGWHVAAIWMRLMVRHQEEARRKLAAAGGPLPRLGPSPGFDDMRWLKPVRAGDILVFSNEVTAKKELSRRRDWGLVSGRNEGVNAAGDLVFAFTSHVLVERRAPEEPDASP